MASRLTVRYAHSRDATAIAALHADSWRRHYRGAYSDAYLDGDLDADRLAVWAQRLDGSSAKTVTLAADAEDGLVGFVHVLIDHDPRWGSLIENLHVRHDHHRRGLGRQLMSAATTVIAGKARRAAIHLWVLQQNSRAQSFYRALGGTCVEHALCPSPGGVAGRLNGAPMRLRYFWRDASGLLCPLNDSG